MPPKALWPPVPKRHASGQARVVIEGRTHYLGVFGSLEASRKLDQLVERTEKERAGRSAKLPPSLTVAELCCAYVAQQEKERRSADGKETGEMGHIRRALRPMIYLLGSMPAAEVAPRHLKDVRGMLVSGYTHPCFKEQKAQRRKTVHANFNRCRAVFKWGHEEGLIPPNVYYGIRFIRGLRFGEAGVKENRKVKPVPPEDLAATLRELGPVVREMVQVQLLCGCRPGEIVRLRGTDVDKSKDPWVWTLAEHKNAWRGHSRRILLGPQAQVILRPFLDRPPEAYYFSPREAVRLADRDWVDRQDDRKPGERYLVNSYEQAIERAAKRAKVPHWTPNQLRHSAATFLRSKYGLDVARAALGHASLETTMIYAEEDLDKAADALKKSG